MKKISTFDLLKTLNVVLIETVLEKMFTKKFPFAKGENFETLMNDASTGKISDEKVEYLRGVYDNIIATTPAYVEKYNASVRKATVTATVNPMVAATVEAEKTSAELIKQYKKANSVRRLKILAEAGFESADDYLSFLGTVTPDFTQRGATENADLETFKGTPETEASAVEFVKEALKGDKKEKTTTKKVKEKSTVVETPKKSKSKETTQKVKPEAAAPTNDEAPLPKEYNKVRILEDVKANGGKHTEFTSTMMELNDLKNIYYKLNAKGNRQRYRNSGEMNDETCRKVKAAIGTLKKVLKGII